jgi:hypothetical protein
MNGEVNNRKIAAKIFEAEVLKFACYLAKWDELKGLVMCKDLSITMPSLKSSV